MNSAITVRRLVAADAPGLTRCFERCYGTTYPSDIFYATQRLATAIEAGNLRSVVAVTENNIIGHTGLTVRHDGARAIEAGNTVVDPNWRGQGLLGELGTALTELCRAEGFAAYVHYPTTAHEIMQKRSVQSGGTETGLMLAYIPAETNYTAIDHTSGRLAATVVFQPCEAMPHRRVYLPERYAQVLKALFDDCNLERTFSAPATQSTGSAAEFVMHERRGLLHAFVTRAAADLPQQIDAASGSATAPVIQVDLCLDDPAVSAAVDALAAGGFYFAALMPEFAHTDVLRLQRINQTSAAEFEPALANPGAQRLLRYIKADRHSSAPA
ncbi:MAG: GNAT family N-acetyltransferase [Gammaproteobacteria bacterium]|nr:GNAT family N-acetyltransferase [Gammaproteobacteria bacterium]